MNTTNQKLSPLKVNEYPKPSWYTVLWVWVKCFAIALIFIATLALPALIILFRTYKDEKKFDNNNTDYDSLSDQEKMFVAAPINVVPVSELFRSFEYHKGLYKTQLNQVSNDEKHELEHQMIEFESFFDEAENLEEPDDYFLTISGVFLFPSAQSKFSDILPGVAVEQLEEMAGLTGLERLRCIPSFFATDFTSIPFGLGQKTGSYTRAAIVHDWAYSYFPIRSEQGRDECDREMLRIMRIDGTPAFTRAKIFCGLRFFGEPSFISAPVRRLELGKFSQNPYMQETIKFSITQQITFGAQSLANSGVIDQGSSKKIYNIITRTHE